MESSVGSNKTFNIAIADKVNATKKDNSKDGIYLFISYDLVDSTAYKTRHSDKWPAMFEKLYSSVVKEMNNEDISLKNAKLWKYLGDEILFYKKVRQKKDLFFVLHDIYSIVKKIQQVFEGELSVKTTAWIAEVKEDDDKAENITFATTIGVDTKIRDFLGTDIDAGFRIAKFANKSTVTVCPYLAKYLAENEGDIKDAIEEHYGVTDYKIKDKIKIVHFERLKGIWSDKPYPIIWYTEEWKADAIFDYEELVDVRHHMRSLVKRVKSVCKTSTPDEENKIDYIETVFSKIPHQASKKTILEGKYKPLKKKLSSTNEQEETDYAVPVARQVESHCVAICVDDEKVLAVKRKDDKPRLPGKWEFGCGQLHKNQTYEEALKETYKEDFGVDIELINNGRPINIFSFEDETKTKISGVIFVAKINEPSELKTSCHSESRLLSKTDIDSMQESDCVDNFKENALLALEVAGK